MTVDPATHVSNYYVRHQERSDCRGMSALWYRHSWIYPSLRAVALLAAPLSMNSLHRRISTSSYSPAKTLSLSSRKCPKSQCIYTNSSRIDAVVSNLNGPALGKAQLALIDAAKEARVKRFLPSEFGSDTNNEKVLEMVELLKGKKRIVDYLRTKEGDGFTWTAVITGLFLDYVGSKYTLVFADVIHYFRCRVSSTSRRILSRSTNFSNP